jgi:hypothetical protein
MAYELVTYTVSWVLVSENAPSMKIGSPPGGACQYRI